MKKIIILISMIFILTSCFWKSSEEIKEEKNDKITISWKKIISKVTTIKWDWFFVKVPSSWAKVNKNKLPDPRVGKVVLALQAKEMKNGFINNFIIIKQKLKKEDSSISFSISNQVRAYKKYVNYKRIDNREVVFSSNDKSIVYIFEARYNSKTPKQKFLQVWKICNKTEAYILTIWINIWKTNYWDYEYLFKSFRCEWDKVIEEKEEKKVK